MKNTFVNAGVVEGFSEYQEVKGLRASGGYQGVEGVWLRWRIQKKESKK